MPLTDLKIRKAKARPKPYKMSDGGGLFLLVKPGGGKLWQQKYRFLGKEGLLSHGQYPAVSLAQARKKREDAKELLAEGRDPSVQKKLDRIAAETQARTTFKLIAEEHLANMEDRRLAPTTLTKNNWLLMRLAEPLHKRPISEISSAEVLHLLQQVERSGRRETAIRLRSILSGVFRLAIVTLRAESDPTEPLKGALRPPKVVNRPAITDENAFGALLRDIEEFPGYYVTIAALKFQILTMVRPGEVRGATKHEIDRVERKWTISQDRMKMRREHVVPLSDQAFEIVVALWPEVEGVELLFPSVMSNRRQLSNNTLNSALRRMGYQKDEVTAHGFRATASTILNSRGFDPEVIEAALAHQDKNEIRRTYNRATYFDQRVELMQTWADLVDEFRSGS
ncbi:tyrosine-type recombinase/integrase [Roseovarius phycicola]|uniref:Integrase arm-type DNA-binding domain-containing protein n=1 Tax=Roseovarius phycicola TaxID=3080976 RepID=A0ABZ2HFN9_9RHOB